jgi:hypothetical protein
MGYGFAASDLKSRLALFAPYVDFVEPANEADNVKHPNWAQMRSDQKNLWETVRSNKAWANIAVSGPSFANPGDHAALVGPLDEYEDFGALHNGTCNWNPGTDITWVSIDANTAKIRVTTRYKPIWTTETGYNDNLTRGCSITDNIIAKYLTRTTTERWLHGEPRTYFNVLVDDPKNVAFGNLGLLHVNGQSAIRRARQPRSFARGSRHRTQAFARRVFDQRRDRRRPSHPAQPARWDFRLIAVSRDAVLGPFQTRRHRRPDGDGRVNGSGHQTCVALQIQLDL